MRTNEKYELEYIFNLINGEKKINLDGDLINISNRIILFSKSHQCCKCGIKGSFFVKEKNPNDKSFHLNMYAITRKGEEILMTKDHIVPKSFGGKNHITNYQTMCVKCNLRKGNNI